MRNNKVLVLIVVVFLFLLLGLAYFLTRESIDIDSYEEEGGQFNSTKYVVVKDPNELLSYEILSPNRRVVFSENIRVYAEKKYDEYDQTSVIGYLVKSTEETNEGKLKITGKFGKSTEDEVFFITKLNNNVLSLEYLVNGAVEFDEDLPINSKINQYIGQLPLEGDGFVIDYISEDETFLITLLSSTAGYENSTQSLLQGTGASSLEELNISYTGRVGMPSPYW